MTRMNHVKNPQGADYISFGPTYSFVAIVVCLYTLRILPLYEGMLHLWKTTWDHWQLALHQRWPRR